MANREKLPIMSNVPMKVKLVFDKPLTGTIKSGENAGEKYTLYAVEHEGTEYSLFGNDALDEGLAPFGKGTEVIITKAEQKNPKTGKVFHTWHVNQALFEDNGKAHPEATPKPDLVNDEAARAALMEYNENLYYTCLLGAQRIVETYERDTVATGKPQLQKEDLGKIAASLFIEFQRKASR